MRRILIAAGALTLAASPAMAVAETSGEWRVLRAIDDGGATAIAIGGSEEHGAILSCVGDKLVALLATEPGDIGEMIDRKTNRTRGKRAVLEIEGKSATANEWTFLPGLQVAQTRKTITAKKLYNAAIRGDSFSWTLSGKDTVTFQFPEINEAFKSFATTCVANRKD